MKLVCSLSSLDHLSILATYVDGIMLEDEEDILEKIHKVKSYKLTVIYRLDEMMFPLEIESVKKKILLTKDTGCLYYITDLGLAHMLKSLGLIFRTIFDPITMITNSLDAKEYMEYGFASIGLSNEITLKDIRQIISKTNCMAFLQVFGYRLMLNSRRKLISLYQEKIQSVFSMENLELKEATRNDYFPIIENQNGTKIYRGEIISLLEEFLSIPLEYAYLNSSCIEENTFMEVVKLFSAVKRGKAAKEANLALKSLELPIGEGFSYRDSVYMKEEF